MGVYIKGIEMPTRCGRCDMCVKEVDGDIDYHYECCITAAIIDNLGEKMEDCPLFPVPPHGRLIDADAFIKRISELVRKAETDGFDLGAVWYTAFIRHIELAPTIIPAEEGE